MRIRIAATALGVALLGIPSVAHSKDENQKGKAGYEEAIGHAVKNGDYQPHEERYLRAYDDYADALGVQAAGRNIVIYGLLTKQGEKPAPKDEVVKDAEMFEAALAAPAETTAVPAESTTTTTTSYSATGNSTVMCESGGDYAANTGNGYFGGYQFDSGTWDAYGDPAYAEANEAPPAVQDAAAASVPYDAWPNC
jgi:hypothetical protein